MGLLSSIGQKFGLARNYILPISSSSRPTSIAFILLFTLSFDNVGILFWLLRGIPAVLFLVCACTLSLMLLSYLLWARRSSALRCPAELVFCARDFYERVFIACSFFDSFGSFCPIYSKKVWQTTKICCK